MTGVVVETGPGLKQYAVRTDGSRNVSIRNRKFLRTFTGVADIMAEDVPQQHPVVEGCPAAQVIRQEESDGNSFQTIDLGEEDNGRDNTMEQIPKPALL